MVVEVCRILPKGKKKKKGYYYLWHFQEKQRNILEQTLKYKSYYFPW